MYYFKTFPYKAVTPCIPSLYSLQIPVSDTEEGKGWLVQEKGPGWASTSSCHRASPCPHSQHGTILARAFLLLLHLASQIQHSPRGAEWGSSPWSAQQCWRSGGIGDWRQWVIVHQAAAAFPLPKESHCSEMASLWASQIFSPSNSPLPSSHVFSLFFIFGGVALALVQHDLIHHFWCSNRFHSSDLAPWPPRSAVSSLPDLHPTQKTSLSQPSVTLACHPMSPDWFGRNPPARSSQMQGITPPVPPPPVQGRTTIHVFWLERKLSGTWAHVFLK